jgi:glutathione S-transferase
MIDLHFDKTPNCWKIAIMLEEVGAKYRVINYDILAGDHLTAAFRVINPNHKLPAIVDDAPADGGAPITVAESAAILIYLADKHGMFLPQQARDRAPVLQWLAWQIAGLGPMKCLIAISNSPKHPLASYPWQRCKRNARSIERSATICFFVDRDKQYERACIECFGSSGLSVGKNRAFITPRCLF